MRRNRPAFTLIEMLVAIGIIAALIAMFFIGYRYVSGSAKANQTQVALQALRSMLNEYEVQGGSMSALSDLYASASANPLTAPGSVSDNGSDRLGQAVSLTRAVMKRLLQVPDNQKIFNSLPRSTTATPGADGGKEFGMVWEAADPTLGPILLDAYNNPIIFVPGKGLTSVNLAKMTNGPPPTYQRPNQTIQAPGASATTPGRPFFASAGEDGNFGMGDDNRYSFEK